MAYSSNDIRQHYPLPVYNYRVVVLENTQATTLAFSEVNGLVMEYERVIYKDGLSFLMGGAIVPGKPQPIHITLKRGMIMKGNYFATWFKTTHHTPSATNRKRDVLIDLCDEKGEAVVRWTVSAALPVKLEAPSLDANSNDVAIETLELVAHSLKVDYDPH